LREQNESAGLRREAGSTLKSVQDIAPKRAWPCFAKLLLAILALASLEQEKIVLQPQARHHSTRGRHAARAQQRVVDVAVMRDRLGKNRREKPSV